MSVIENVPKIDFNTHLECPVCLDFAASPIHTCRNGHLVCGICEEKTKICPTCQADNLMVNDFVERVLKAEGVVVPCRNSQHGCTLLVPPSEMKTHLKDSCDFRPIECHEVGNLCDRKSFHPKDLFKHWVDIHKMVKNKLMLMLMPSNCPNSPIGLLGSFTRQFAMSKAAYEAACKTDARGGSWKIGYVEIDGQIFLLHFIIDGGNFQAWVTLLGMESVATKYGFTSTISSYQDDPEKRITFPMIPIHSSQYYCTKKMNDLGRTVSVRVKALKLIQDQKPSNPDNYLKWKVRLDIFGVQDPTNTVVE